MNGIDYCILSILLLSIGVGIIRGAIREVMNIVAWVLAYILAHTFASDIAPYFSEWVGEPAARTVLAWVVVFLVVLIFCALLTSLLGEVVKKMGLSPLDRTVGAMIGAARGLLILLAITLAVGLTRIPQGNTWREAALTPWLEVAALYARGVLPESIASKIRYRLPPTTAKT
jgi:membrane protein required for colicin V production